MIRSSLTLLILCFAFMADMAVAQGYKVIAVKGRAWGRHVYGDGWKVLKPGAQLKVNDVVKVAGRSTLVIGISNLTALGTYQAQGTISIDRPLMVRINKDLIRSVAVKTQHFVPYAGPSERAKPTLWSFADIKSRVVAFISGVPYSAGEMQKVALNVAVKPLKIFVPLDDEYFFTPHFPTNVQIVWQKAPKAPGYNVYLQSMANSEEQLYGMTDQESFVVSIPTNGKYRVRVESSDRKFQSEAVQFSVSTQLTTQKNAFDDDDSATPGQPTVRLVSPRDGIRLITAKHRETVYFTWRTDSAKQGDTYLRVYQANGSTFGTIKGYHNTAQLQLPAGKYLWQVLQTAEGFDTPLATSAKNDLTIAKSGDVARLAADELKHGTEDATIQLLP